MAKDPPAMWETSVWSLGMVTPSSILAWEFHGQRKLAGYSPCGLKKPDMTEQLTHKTCFIIKCWIFQVVYWLLYWKWKTEWVIGVKNVVSSLLLPSTRRVYHTVYYSPGKDQNSKFEIWFLLNIYHYHTIIKSENHKSGIIKLDPLLKLKNCVSGWRVVGTTFVTDTVGNHIVTGKERRLQWSIRYNE